MWHRRARKTTFGLNLLIRECVKNPSQVYGFIAPTYTQAKGIIWTDPNMLDKYLPHWEVKRKNESELIVEFKNKSILAIQGADNPDAVRGKDYRGVFIDEFALCKREIWEEILRPVLTHSKDRWGIFAYTPKGLNHAYEYWSQADSWEGWYKSILRASESGIIPSEELIQAKKEMPEILYKQEFECDFLAGDEFTVIRPSDIELLKNVFQQPLFTKRIISCDPSQGGDVCQVYVFENTKVIEEKELHLNDTMKIVGELMLLGAKYKTKSYSIDSIGIGKGVVDRLSELGQTVLAVNSAESSTDDRFYNRRAEMWWYVLELMQRREIEYFTDAELKRQLTSVRYKVINSNGLIQLEPKQETKKRLGRSPDKADAFVYGLWGLHNSQEFETNEEIKFNRKHSFSGAAGW